MKKSNLITGIIFLFLGIGLFAIALLTNTKATSLLYGFAGGLIGSGIALVCKYLYWNSPKNRERYIEKIENEKIELQDELKEKLRDKSGRYTYILGLAFVLISATILSVLITLGIISKLYLPMMIYLYLYLVFQFVGGIVIFKHLSKKYN